MKQLLLLNGPSCVGKSTTVDALMHLASHWYHLSYDRQKWAFSQYRDHIAEYRSVLQDLLLVIAQKMMTLEYPIITDSLIEYEYRGRLIELGREYGYTIHEVNLEAPWEVISSRFSERLSRAESNPSHRMANTSHDRARELYELYESDKNIGALTLRTDQMSTDQIVGILRKYMDV